LPVILQQQQPKTDFVQSQIWCKAIIKSRGYRIYEALQNFKLYGTWGNMDFNCISFEI